MIARIGGLTGTHLADRLPGNLLSRMLLSPGFLGFAVEATPPEPKDGVANQRQRKGENGRPEWKLVHSDLFQLN